MCALHPHLDGGGSHAARMPHTSGATEVIDRKIAHAKVVRDARKAKRDQLKAIKKALKTPIAQIKAEAARKAEAEKLPSMSEGAFIKGAPFGKGALVFKPGDKIEQIGAAISRSEALGGNDYPTRTDKRSSPIMTAPALPRKVEEHRRMRGRRLPAYRERASPIRKGRREEISLSS